MTLLDYAAPVTDPRADPTFDHLRGIVADLDRAAQRVKDLERERDEEIVRVIGEDPPRGRITAVVAVANRSRQQIDTIRRIARARLEGQQSRQS